MKLILVAQLQITAGEELLDLLFVCPDRIDRSQRLQELLELQEPHFLQKPQEDFEVHV